MDEYLICEMVRGKMKQKSNRIREGPNRKGSKSSGEEGKREEREGNGMKEKGKGRQGGKERKR